MEKGSFLPEKDDLFFDGSQLIAPGFIDAHGHSDISLLAMPDAAGKTAQGIAFEISGNCGLSPFPLTENNYEHLCGLYRQYKIPLTWQNYTSYTTCLRSVRITHLTQPACAPYSPRWNFFRRQGITLCGRQRRAMKRNI